MKSVALALSLAALLLSAVTLQQWYASAWLVAPVIVVVGVLGASSLQAGVSWLSVVAGALSPLALQWVDPVSPWLAMSALCLLWAVPRIWLARTVRALLVLGAAGLLLSLLAGWMTSAYTHDTLLHGLAACVFAGASLSLLPLLSRTDTPVAHALDVSGRVLDDSPVRTAILAAADFHRTQRRERFADSVPGTKWRKLAAMADRRAAMHKNAPGAAIAAREQLDAALLALAAQLTTEPPSLAPAPPVEQRDTPRTTPAEPAGTGLPDTVMAEQPASAAAQEPAPAVDPNLAVNATVP